MKFLYMFLSSNIIDMDIISILYLIIRLSPLLVVSHFMLGSILNSDPKGMIYLAGLVLTCIIAVGFGKAMPDTIINPSIVANCDTYGLNTKNVSLGIVTLCFTYLYLMLIIFKMDSVSYYAFNLPTIVLFPILITAYTIWVGAYTKCINWGAIGMSIVIGSLGGATWFGFVKSTGYQDLALFNGISNKAVCMKASKSRFSCKPVVR